MQCCMSLQVSSLVESYLDNLYIHGVKAFLALLHFECHLVVFTNLVDEPAYMYKDVL